MVISQEERKCVSEYEQHQQEHLFFFSPISARHLIGIFYGGISDDTVQTRCGEQPHKHIDYKHQL